MYRLATKCSDKNELPKLIYSVEYGYMSRKRKRHIALPVAQCENKQKCLNKWIGSAP